MNFDIDHFMFAYTNGRPPTVQEMLKQQLMNAQTRLEEAKSARARLASQLADKEAEIRKLDAACMEYSHWLRNNK